MSRKPKKTRRKRKADDGLQIIRIKDPQPSTPAMYGAVDKHDHTGGWVGCTACQAEHVAERVGGVGWTVFIQDIMRELGAKPARNDDDLNLRRVKAMGVDIEDAKNYWVRNFTGAGYIALRPQLKLPPSERTDTWNGMAPCGKHGADFKGQACDICSKLLLPDKTVEVRLTTREVLERIERWAEACHTAKMDTGTIHNVSDLVYSIQDEVEQWITVLEDD